MSCFLALDLEDHCLRVSAWRQQKNSSWVNTVIFSAALAVALYLVTDLKYPRLGLIRVDSLGQFLDAVYEQMR